MTHDFPPDLLDAQRDFYEATARVKAAADAMPLSSLVLAGEVEPASDEQREEWAAAQEEQLRCIRILYSDPLLEAVGDRPDEARRALQQAAKA